jgi:tetratricopeptide (TPR) repeat protein
MLVKSFIPTASFFAVPLVAIVIFLIGVRPAWSQTQKSAPQSTPLPTSSPQPTLAADPTTGSRATTPTTPPSKPEGNPNTAPTPTETPSVPEETVAPKPEIAILRDEINEARNDQTRTRLQLKLVDHLVSVDRKQEAIAELKAMGEEDRFDPQGFYNIANAQVRLGAWEDAVNSYRKAIGQRNGRYSRALNNLGVVLLREGRWNEAYDAFITALRQESFHYAEASFNLGRLYAARGEHDLAVREWKRALAVDPKHDAAAKALANTRGAGNIAVGTYISPSAPRPAVNQPPTTMEKTRATSNVGSSRPKDVPTAGPKRDALPPAPAYTIDAETYALLQRGRSAREQGRYEEAVDNFRRVLDRTGGYFPPANLELSFALTALKRLDEAITILQPVVQRNGTEIPLSHYHLGRLYELRGELKVAEEHFTRTAEVYGDKNPQFILDVGRVQEKQGNLADALKSLERYISAMERQGQRPSWSDERLAILRQRIAASKPKP